MDPTHSIGHKQLNNATVLTCALRLPEFMNASLIKGLVT